MKASEITTAWLQDLSFKVQSVYQPPTIHGVVLRNLQPIVDGRGDVTVLWSKPWIDEGLSEVEHVYQSATDYGVVKCWHLHELHTDQFVVTRGKLQVTLVLHGWKALTQPGVIVTNLQSHVYSPDDEFKFPWDCVIPEVWQPRNG